MTLQDLYDVIKMFPEEENDEVFRRADNSQKRHQDRASIDRLGLSF